VSLRVSGAAEGAVDDAVLRRLLRDAGHEVDAIYAQGGKSGLLKRLQGYNAAARLRPWIVLIDLNGDAACAPEYVASTLPSPAKNMCFRVAVRQVESWLLADRQALARHLKVSQAHIPRNPDGLPNAKAALVNIARRSTGRGVREGMVPTPGSGRQVGVAYTATMIEFIEGAWKPEDASTHSNSLRRCLERLREL
jgi:hypothetical protein